MDGFVERVGWKSSARGRVHCLLSLIFTVHFARASPGGPARLAEDSDGIVGEGRLARWGRQDIETATTLFTTAG